MTGRLGSILLLGLVVCSAQQQHDHPPASEKPVALLQGMGRYQYTIHTSNPEAQRFFNQGLNLLYGFNRYEALRSFQKASELDPKALMPYVGIAMALGPHINMDSDGDYQPKESCAALDKAKTVRESAPEQERAFLEAVASRCPEYQPASYGAAMHRLAQRYPDDLEAQTFYAESLMIPSRWHWFNSNGSPADGMDDAIRTLEGVMRRNPEHPGANHFYIHAVEMSTTPERAIPSAQRLMGIVPGAGHLVHMPGHIWLRVGDYETAANVNERAAEVDRQYMAATGVTGSSYMGYYVHNLHFVAVARQMQGRKDDAVKAGQVIGEALAPFLSGPMAPMADAFVPMQWFAYLRFQMWDQMLAAPAPPASLAASIAVWHFARGVALVGLGKRTEAMSEEEAFSDSRAKVPADYPWLANKARAVLDIAEETLQAKLAVNDEAAIPHWMRAVEFEDQLSYDEPPAWFYPVRQSLGGALLRAGKAAAAEAVFREGLRRRPRDGRLLFGLVESLRAQKNERAVELVRKEYDEAWRRADTVLRIGDL